MAVSFIENIDDFILTDKSILQRWLSQIIQEDGKRVGKIVYLFSNDEYVHAVNKHYLRHDTYTDIITFDYVEGDLISGDILISIDRVKENARKFCSTFSDELHRVIVHGVLHLLGQGDKSKQELLEMRKKENSALAKLQEIIVKK